MKELIDISDAFETLCAQGKPAALATVIAVEGSSYRKPGARMLIAEDGRTWGCVSGGCLDRDVARRGRIAIASGTCEIHRYDADDEDDAPGAVTTGCGGSVIVFIQPISATNPGPLAAIRGACAEARTASTLATVVSIFGKSEFEVGQTISLPSDSITIEAGVRGIVRCGDVELFVERIAPPQQLLIFGGGPDVPPLLAISKALGWTTSVVAARPAHGIRERLSDAGSIFITGADAPLEAVPPIEDDCAVIIMTHNLARDARILRALPADVRYIGLLGPLHRTRKLLNELPREIAQRVGPRLFAPVGLDIGAASPEEIALSIAAEIQLVVRGRGSIGAIELTTTATSARPDNRLPA